MQQEQRRDIQDWLNLLEQQNKVVSLRWSFVAKSGLTFKPAIPGAVILGFNGQVASWFRRKVKSRRLNPALKKWVADFFCNKKCDKLKILYCDKTGFSLVKTRREASL